MVNVAEAPPSAARDPEPGVAGRVRAQAARTPDAPAVTFGSCTLSYADLDERGTRFARRLAALGVGPDRLVGVFLERSEAMVVALLGIARAGGAYVPLDPGLPPARLAFMLADSGADLLVTQRSLVAALPGGGVAQVVCIDEVEPHDAAAPLRAAEPDHLAFVIYTSGSTGRPKGVEIRNRALVNLLTSMGASPGPGLDSTDVLVAVTTLSFDIAGLELWLPLITGAHLVIASPAQASDPEALIHLLDAAGATVMQATPATWRMLVDAGWKGRPGFTALCGGEALPVALADRILDLGVELWNLYGPTETTIWSTAGRVTTRGSSATLGRPIANTTLYILDPDLAPVPVGIPGELHIGGTGLARGYLGRPDITAGRFVCDPFAAAPGARMYKTGDLVRRRPDGELEYLGRLDQQVKVRGFRVECGEVEAALEAHPAVRSAVVTSHEAGPGDTRLVAYVVTDDLPSAPRRDPAGHIAAWRQVYDDAQAEGTDVPPGDDTFDTSGWISRATLEPVPPAEIAELVDATVARMLALRPRRVLEIGCGTGLILWRVAPHCDAYVGTDLSGATLAVLERRLVRRGIGNVRLFQREAADFSGLPDEPYDLVVANSVVQYFPTADHLRRVVAEAVRRTGGGGTVMLGDVRSLPLLDSFHASISRQRAEENELILDPAFFFSLADDLPRVSHVEVLLRRGRHHNEFTRFRYDVLLHVGERRPPLPVPRWLDWADDGLAADRLGKELSMSLGPLGVTRVPNRRIDEAGVDPEDVWHLGEELGFEVTCSWGNADATGSFDVAFVPGDGPNPGIVQFPRRPTSGPLHNDPLAAGRPRDLIGALRSALQASLPEYMVPSAIVRLPALPLTPNGKVDRAALPPPGQARTCRATPLRTATEKALAAIWAEVLDVDAVGADDNFFELGGHSLLAVRVISAVRRDLSAEVTLRAVFDAPTVAGLARAVDAAAAIRSAPAVAPLLPVPRDGGAELPLTFAQEALWFLDQLAPGNPFFNVPSAYRLRGPVEVAALERALSGIVARHEALRTTFPGRAGRPSVRIASAASVTVEVEDLDEDGARRRAAAEAAQPFDLAEGPLLRARLVRLGRDDHVLLLTSHHVVSDAWSTAVLLRELSATYGPSPSPLPALPVQYADYAAWQRRELGGAALDTHLAWWQRRLAGVASATELPTDRPRPQMPSYRGAIETFVVPSAVAARLRAVARTHRASLHMTLLAACKVLLARLTGHRDVALAGTVSGRDRAEVEHLIGLFANTVVLRTDLAGAVTFEDVLREVRATTLEAFEHQHAPFDKVVERVKPSRDPSRHPLVQIAFDFEEHTLAPTHLGGMVTCRNVGGFTGAEFGAVKGEVPARLDLEVFLAEAPDGSLHASLVYATDLYERATITRFARQYRALLESVAADPHRPVFEPAP